jgi:rhamnosyltransferase subunit B
MKVILCASGTDGDIHPLLGIGLELVSRGHEVLFFTTEHYLQLFRRFGLPAISFHSRDEGEAFWRGAHGKGALGRMAYSRKWVAQNIPRWCGLLSRHIDGRTVLVAAPILSCIARPIHEKFGTPLVTLILAPSYLFSLRNPPLLRLPVARALCRLPYWPRKALYTVLERLVLDQVLGSMLRPALLALGLPMPKSIYSDWVYSPQHVIGLFHEWFSQRQAPDDWPRHLSLCGFPLFSENNSMTELPRAVEEFLGAGAPPIVFTPGTKVVGCQPFFSAALRCLRALGRRGIFLTRDAGAELPRLPSDVLHASYLPLNLLLPRVAALVHHGGIGTCAFAMASGTPQLVVPAGHVDQFDNARLVAELGCGLVVPQPAEAEVMLEQLTQLLQSARIKQTCRAIQVRMAPGEISRIRAADIIEQTLRP